eukprot:14080621-Ditylum_brightwellii.AAC.1
MKDGSKISQQEFFTIINNALQTAMIQMTPLNQWLPVHILFILKEVGNYKVSQLCLIQKVDTELNLLR